MAPPPRLQSSTLLGAGARAESQRDSQRSQPTLEREVGAPDFARRGWYRLADLADYLSSLVDGRSAGLFVVGSSNIRDRLLGLASVVKAAAQWFGYDHDARLPPFVRHAERYLSESRHGQPFYVPFLHHRQQVNMRTGPVVAHKRGRGAAGRLHSLALLVGEIADILEKLGPEDLHIHLAAYKAGAHLGLKVPRPKEHWILPLVLADTIAFSLANGTLSDLLQEQGFQWANDLYIPELAEEMAVLIEDMDLSADSAGQRREHLEQLSRRCIRVALSTLGIDVPRDLFRDRRSG
jgi:hypothetical protein